MNLHPLQSGPLDESAILVWVADLDDRSISEELLDLILSSEELERAGRFKFEQDAWHYKICRTLLRLGIALQIHQPAKAISIRIADRGKPYIPGIPIFFNVSHCRGMGLLAFTGAGEVGVDVEAVNPELEALEIASEYFNPEETSWIAAAEDKAHQAQRFTRLWTRKEAVLKATGSGLLDSLRAINVLNPASLKVRTGAREESVMLSDIEVDASTMGALAAFRRPSSIHTEKVAVADVYGRVEGRTLPCCD